jgi:hypothetical protein
VSFCLPVLPLLAGEKIATGGLELNTLKKENGARLATPFLSIVLAKQMGLGPIAPNI